MRGEWRKVVDGIHKRRLTKLVKHANELTRGGEKVKNCGGIDIK